jgi:hypothetical protein
MGGAIIENMSSRKLAILGAVLLLSQVLCFLVGAVFAPNPNNSDQFLATWCKVPNALPTAHALHCARRTPTEWPRAMTLTGSCREARGSAR